MLLHLKRQKKPRKIRVGSGTVQRIAREMRGERPFEDVNNAA